MVSLYAQDTLFVLPSVARITGTWLCTLPLVKMGSYEVFALAHLKL
jgi:hypothetical protein